MAFPCCADAQKHMPFTGGACNAFIEIVDQANSADCWCGQDRLPVCFIVKRHVARNDWHVERLACSADPFQGTNKLAHDLGLFRVSEVQIIR